MPNKNQIFGLILLILILSNIELDFIDRKITRKDLFYGYFAFLKLKIVIWIMLDFD